MLTEASLSAVLSFFYPFIKEIMYKQEEFMVALLGKNERGGFFFGISKWGRPMNCKGCSKFHDFPMFLLVIVCVFISLL